MARNYVQLEFDDPDHRRSFRSFERLLDWIAEERSTWQRLIDLGRFHGNVGGIARQHVTGLTNEITAPRDRGLDIQESAEVFRTFYGPSRHLRHSGGELGLTLNRNRGRLGDNNAAFAFAFRNTA